MKNTNENNPSISGTTVQLSGKSFPAWLESEEGIKTRTRLKKLIIKLQCEGKCADWQVENLFKKYDLRSI